MVSAEGVLLNVSPLPSFGEYLPFFYPPSLSVPFSLLTYVFLSCGAVVADSIHVPYSPRNSARASPFD